MSSFLVPTISIPGQDTLDSFQGILDSYMPMEAAVSNMYDNRDIAAISSYQHSGTQQMRLHFWESPRDCLAAGCYMRSSTTAGTSMTVVRMGLYTVNGSGDGTLVAAIANDATIFAIASTEYQRSLMAPYQILQGQLYATGILILGTGTFPTIIGNNLGSISGIVNSTTRYRPRKLGNIGSLSDLPSSFVAGDVGVNGVGSGLVTFYES